MRRAGLTCAEPRITNDTNDFDTPARSATSRMVGRRPSFPLTGHLSAVAVPAGPLLLECSNPTCRRRGATGEERVGRECSMFPGVETMLTVRGGAATICRMSRALSLVVRLHVDLRHQASALCPRS
ncbi:hypothetical protein GCM10025787_47880 [Saccharopolyspora rosea]